MYQHHAPPTATPPDQCRAHYSGTATAGKRQTPQTKVYFEEGEPMYSLTCTLLLDSFTLHFFLTFDASYFGTILMKYVLASKLGLSDVIDITIYRDIVFIVITILYIERRNRIKEK